MKKALLVILSFIMLALCLIGNSNAYAQTSARGMCVLEMDSLRVLYHSNEHERLGMASTTKIVTAITVIENCQNLDEIVTVNDRAVGVEGSSIYLKKGEKISVRDLLYGLMLRSGNDSAEALAYHVAGSIPAFADLMNKLAVKLELKNSHFTNPHGLDDKNHYTSAYDLAKITAYALNNNDFKVIVSSKKHIAEKTNMQEARYMVNKNKLLSTLDGCIGVKTGYTKRSGRCLVSACERNGETVICVVLNCGPMFEESKALLNSAYYDYDYTKIIDKNKEIYNEYLLDDENVRLYLYANEDYCYPLLSSEKEKIKLQYEITKTTAVEGDEVGEIKIFFDNHLIKTLKLYTMNKIDKLGGDNLLKFEEKLWDKDYENKQVFSTSRG